jgi:hypothetical protein
MIAAYVCRTGSNISTICLKRSERRGEFVLTIILLLDCVMDFDVARCITFLAI